MNTLSFPCFLSLDHVCCQSIYASENPLPVGSNVTLYSQAVVTTGVWMFETNLIVMIFPGSIIIHDTWRDRVSYNSTSSALTIKSLRLGDSGLYTLQTVNSFRGQLTLSVQGRNIFSFIFHVYTLTQLHAYVLQMHNEYSSVSKQNLLTC